MGKVTTPTQPSSESEEETASGLESQIPKRHPSGRAQYSDADARPAQSDGDPMGIIDDDLEAEGDHLV